MNHAIEVRGLVRDFGGTRALDGVNLHVPSGQVLGIALVFAPLSVYALNRRLARG